MEMTPTMQQAGCTSTIIAIGGFFSGMYAGFSTAKGNPTNEALMTACKYGPSLLGAGAGFSGGSSMVQDPKSLEGIMEHAPPNATVENAKGCYPIASGVSSLGITALATYVGYLVGTLMGNQS